MPFASFEILPVNIWIASINAQIPEINGPIITKEPIVDNNN